jgi:hypothetical protein
MHEFEVSSPPLMVTQRWVAGQSQSDAHQPGPPPVAEPPPVLVVPPPVAVPPPAAPPPVAPPPTPPSSEGVYVRTSPLSPH